MNNFYIFLYFLLNYYPMSTDNDSSIPSGDQKPKKLKLKLKQKSGGKGLNKPSLKLGKKPLNKPVSLKPSASPEDSSPPPGLTQPPMASTDTTNLPIPPNPIPAPISEVPEMPSPIEFSDAPTLPPPPQEEEVDSELPPIPGMTEETSEVTEAESEGNSILPPPPAMGESPTESEMDSPDSAPSLGLPPMPDTDLPPSPPGEASVELAPLPGIPEELPESSIDEGEDDVSLSPLPVMSEPGSDVELPSLPPVPDSNEPSSELPPLPDTTEEQPDSLISEEENEKILPPPPEMGEPDAEMGTIPPLPPVPGSDELSETLPPPPSAHEGSTDTPEDGAEEGSALPVPPAMDDLLLGSEENTLQSEPKLSSIVDLEPTVSSVEESVDDVSKEDKEVASIDVSAPTNSISESPLTVENNFMTPPPMSEKAASEKPDNDGGDDKEENETTPLSTTNTVLTSTEMDASVEKSDNDFIELTEKVTSLSDEFKRFKNESREELDSLFKRVDELDEIPAALKSEDEKVEVLTNSFDELKISLHEDIASFKKTIEGQLAQNTESGSIQPSSTKSILSESGEVSWKEGQYVVVSQDENAGDRSPLEVSILDSKNEALEKIHANMTSQKPIYFLFPSNLESEYHEKF